MASRAARFVLANVVRAPVRSFRATQQIGRRHTSTAESSHGPASSSSDRPWMVGSALIFGPFFLYLLSPSARKKHAVHATHDDKHDSGAHVSEHEPATPHAVPEVKMKDDEGAEANVSESLSAAEHADAPKVGEAVESTKEFTFPNVSSTPSIEKIGDRTDGEVERNPPESDTAADETVDPPSSQFEKLATVQAGDNIDRNIGIVEQTESSQQSTPNSPTDSDPLHEQREQVKEEQGEKKAEDT